MTWTILYGVHMPNDILVPAGGQSKYLLGENWPARYNASTPIDVGYTWVIRKCSGLFFEAVTDGA